jgi:rod shape-determining protein MreD
MDVRDFSALNLILAALFFLSLVAGKVTTGSFGSVEIGLYFLFLFLWAARSEHNLTAAVVLLFGFFQDVLTGSALGFWPLIFLVFFGLVRSQAQIISQAPKSALFFIVFFSILLAYAIMLALASLASDSVDYGGVMGSFLVTEAIVPLAVALLSYAIPLGVSSHMRR